MKNVIKQQRLYIVGSEWLYFNIYIGPQTSNKFLNQTLEPFASKLLEKKVIYKWFYIRYKDEIGLHLRVRFHLCNPKKGIGEVIIGLNESITEYIENKLISNITINTYKREMERYGFHTIEEFESLFYINTKLILTILKYSEMRKNFEWLLGMKGIDCLLNLFNYSLKDKKELLEELKISFGEEFGASKDTRKQLSKKYRENKFKIEDILNKDTELDLYFDEFENESRYYVNNIINSYKKPEIINDLIESYIHMHCNRLFKSKQRLNEWILYDLLFQYYNSKLARKRIEHKNNI